MTSTTLPILPTYPPTIQTDRLLLRPFSPTDVTQYHVLRQQPEVMIWTSAIHCDETISQTQEWMARHQTSPDLRTFSFSIEELSNPGQVIGSAGCSVVPGKQPEVGYMFRKEMWGRGYATEAVKAVLNAYWNLERGEVEVESHLEKEGIVVEKEHCDQCKDSVDYTSYAAGFQVEKLSAVTVSANVGSRRVLEKLGFVMVKEFKDWDTGGRECIEYILQRPRH
ncbi:hypothetical protein EPUS_05361 [Endocarpon pusillum Z07020]|uniref:N-acetyltransferase domain-containing protein n=1 Tax=Endocarpon pusillum (strain Z07020 / HMAS-L-300199) TaxID=1263415 RepID=U1GNQ8_ENDPU|nr:uncharacterized protein EPUS_05361 [Endocarpon pusillum Z07020]ERF73938.1 hypothetical protein EPUS_05361 [Endocarpon pusillum Z07020]